MLRLPAIRGAAALAALTLGLSSCATTASLPPTQVVRYHVDRPIERGTVTVEPLAGGPAPSLEFQAYAAAVQAEMVRNGYSLPTPGAQADYVAVVDFRRTTVEGPQRRSPISIGLGGGGFSGGHRGGGVGLGGGLSFPLGRSRSQQLLSTEMHVLIKHRADQEQLWEGNARTLTDLRAPEATADGQARKLAAALFTGFPGESGRTIEVK